MGNCTSKKSDKLLKSTTARKPLFKKMDKEQDNNISKGLSKKIAPFTKGEVTSFGFRRKPNSSLPVPVTLTSHGNSPRDIEDKKIQNGALKNKEIIDDTHSGSSVESLCHHAPLRSTPKMIRKKDLAKQTRSFTGGINNNNNPNQINENLMKTTVNASTNNNHTSRISFHPSVTSPVSNSTSQGNNVNNNSQTASLPPANRFGFRQQKPVRFSEPVKTETNSSTVEARWNNSNLGSHDTGTYRVVKKNDSVRSKSEGPREAFFKQTLQPAGSVQSVLGQSKSNISNIPQPGRFTLQTSHLPRPQFAVKMPDAKTAKTVTNYYRRGGTQSDSNSSKEGSLNDDSGFETQSNANGKADDSFESPGFNVRRRLQTSHGKKLEMKVVGNKFELLDKADEKESNVVTEVSLIKLPIAGVRASTAIINTGLVEQRTNQYLKRISQHSKNDLITKPRESIITRSNTRMPDSSSDSSHVDEGFEIESEEEKLFKDRKVTEKSTVNYLMNDGCEDDDLVPGEAMADDISLSFSSDDETSTVAMRKKMPSASKFNLETDITPNTIRLDALKLSKQLKSGNAFMVEAPALTPASKTVLKVDNSSLETGELDDETLPSDSILEQISSDSDSVGDKGLNNINGKEKIRENLVEEIEIEELEDVDDKKIEMKSIDSDISDSDLNIDEKELNDIPNNPGESRTPPSPGTPTNASNSLSLSEGRDFLIDDEIADQPQLCLTETCPDCSCQEEVKTCNDKTILSCGSKNEFLSCVEGTVLYKNESTQAVSDPDDVEPINFEINHVGSNIGPGKRERRLNSAGTLSPCESLTSDDLMMDFESSMCDDASERINYANGQADGDESIKVIEESIKDFRPHSSQRSHPGAGGGILLKSRTGSSTPGSPRSGETIPSPLRSTRSGPSDDDAIKLDKTSYENMFQDIAGIKKMLLKLKQVLTESEADEHENGIRTVANDLECPDEMSDLRRQVTFLQQQLEEREKTVQNLQMEISKSFDGCRTNGTSNDTKDRCNAATQTDRVRPISTGPSILQTLPSDSSNLVSKHFSNPKITNSQRNQSRSRTELAHDERNTKGFVSVKKSPHVEKIMDKVKELSFKPVEVLEKEEETLKAQDSDQLNSIKLTTNGLLNGNPIFKHFEMKNSENCRKPTKNVFKITKIDLVLKSDNYGKNQVTQSNR